MEIWLVNTQNFTAKLIHIGMKLYCMKNKWPIPEVIYNHALIYDPEQDCVYEADFPVVVRISKAEWAAKKKNKTAKVKVVELKTTDRQRRAMLSYLSVQVGKSYELSNFLWHTVKIATGNWSGNTTDKQHYCYELVIRAINNVWPSHFNTYLNPYEFNEMISKNSSLFSVNK